MPASSPSSPTAPATVPGAPPRFWLRSTHSRNGRGGADFPRDPSCGSAAVLCGFRHLSENHGPTRQTEHRGKTSREATHCASSHSERHLSDLIQLVVVSPIWHGRVVVTVNRSAISAQGVTAGAPPAPPPAQPPRRLIQQVRTSGRGSPTR